MHQSLLFFIALGIMLTAEPVRSARMISVKGNRFINTLGQTVILQGFSHSGTEFACLHGQIFDGQVDNAAIAAMKTWNVNLVRLPLNEDCWLAINGVPPTASGGPYQAAIIDYIDRLWAHGIYTIVDLHWTAPGTAQATGQQPMPDSDHAPAFWMSVAAVLKCRTYVIFDVFNEPYPDRVGGGSSPAAWTCWRDGGTCAGINFHVAGMQSLVDAVRSTGAQNIIILGGLNYANDLTQWLKYRPTDPLSNVAASTHIYNFNQCISTGCWDATFSPILAAGIPVMIGEFGENDCGGSFVKTLVPWYVKHNVSHSAWTWNTWNCSSGPALISDYKGTCTGYGCPVRTHFLAFPLTPTPK